MAKRKQEELTIAVKVEIPTGVNAKMVMDHIRWALSTEAISDENKDPKTIKMLELEYRVKLLQRVTNYV